ncbi:hypothetical protein [Marinobacter alexandrii]|uniref:hypothetical protein n=1 Tax=Marinobacter alexandrii TaxID=2570351 RepID=UPI001107B6AB|nr:hypothetical protein [Marinobacter alexandrii]
MASIDLYTGADVGPYVRLPSLEPVQHRANRRFRSHCDFWQQRLLKHPHRSEFHSRAEYLHAGLLEGNPAVTAFVPQPFLLQVGRQWYTPDVYVVEDGRRRVVEIKPEGRMDEALQGPVTAFFARHDVAFEVVANERILEQQQAAENWLELVRRLVAAGERDTTVAETQVWEALLRQPQGLTLGALIDGGARERTYTREIALYRLMHRGRVRAPFHDKRLDFDLELTPWP